MTESKQQIPKSFSKREILELCADLTMLGVEELIWELDQKFQERATSSDAALIKKILKLVEALTFAEQVQLKSELEDRHQDDNEWLRAELNKVQDDIEQSAMQPLVKKSTAELDMECEVASVVLAEWFALCAKHLAEERDAETPNRGKIDALEAQLRELNREKMSIGVDNTSVINKALYVYAPLLKKRATV
jgi:hypothetical protein